MKKILSVMLCIAVMFCSFMFSVDATEEKTVLYLDFGNVVIGTDSVTGFDIEGNSVSVTNPVGYVITQADSSVPLDRGITVASGSQNIELNNVNIKRINEYDCAFAINGTAGADIVLTGENSLVSGTYRAGLEIAVKANAVIGGDGYLYAESRLEAGIGGGNGKSNGTLTVNSGVIYAVGGIGGYSAGIGGGSSGKGGKITINGGDIVAVGGTYAAGIGGGNLCDGGNITVNGGTVTAVGGKNGAGIGGGYLGNGGTIVINGGTVKATAGENAENIGNGYNCKSQFSGIVNSDGEAVSLLNVEINDYDRIFIDGIDSYPVKTGHPDDTGLYLYSASDCKHLTVYKNDGTVKYYRYNNAEIEEVYPFISDVELTQGQLIYAGSLCTEENYSCTDSELYYGDVCIDRFSEYLRGDVNFDGKLDGMDAVTVSCVCNSMIDDALTVRLSDVDKNGAVDDNDVHLLEDFGLMKY